MIFAKLTVLTLTLLVYLTRAAHAQDLNSEKDNYDRAYRDYYDEVKKRPNATEDEIKQLENQILTPARKSFQDSFHEQRISDNNTAIQHGKDKEEAENKARTAADKSQSRGKSSDNDDSSQETNNPQANSGDDQPQRPSFQPSGLARPEFTLDGREIPKEIEFKPATPPPKK